MSVTLSITGMETVRANLKQYGERAMALGGQALYQEAEIVMTDAKENYVPVDQGILRASGFVNPPQADGDEVSVTMGFGGAASDYAIVQHERMDFKHTTGGPKFLERPVMSVARTLAQRIAARIKGLAG